MKECIISRGLDAPAKLRDTREASNGGRVRVRIVHGLNINQKNSCSCCKNLEVIKNQSTARMLLGG